MAAIEYYENDSEWGNYQYTSLDEVINNYSMSRTSDDYTADIPRPQILFQATRGLREFYYDILQEIIGISLDLSPSLQVTLPPDFVNYVRISWLDEQGQLHPMAMDNRMDKAKAYLQDSNYGLLFDDSGCVLIGSDTINSGGEPVENLSEGKTYCSFSSNNFQPNRNMSNVYVNGKYTIDRSRGIIQFGSDAKSKTIVLEYISDGIFTGCEGRPESERRVNKFAESALMDYIYYELIKKRRNVPANEKVRARKEYYNSRRVAKMRINTLRKEELIQTFKGSLKWIK
jgi:hypothetical protein